MKGEAELYGTCKNGHPWSPENTRKRKNEYGRACRACKREESRRRDARAKAARPGRTLITDEELRSVTEARFWASVVKTDGCWLWQGKVSAGYGLCYVNAARSTTSAHRVAWVLAGNDLPTELHLDHLCRVTLCVNPSHLEPVTPAENSQRSWAFRRGEVA